MAAPEVVTSPADEITHAAARLNGTVDPNSEATDYFFEMFRGSNPGESLRTGLLDLDPLWMWAPARGETRLLNLGSADNGLEATLRGDARIVDDLLLPGGAAVSLGGAGHVDTGVPTRTNLYPNPYGFNLNTTGLDGPGLIGFSAVKMGQGGHPALPQEVLDLGIETAFRCIADSDADNARFILTGVTPGRSFRFSTWILLVGSDPGNGVRLQMAGSGANAQTAKWDKQGVWTRLDLTATSNASGVIEFQVRQEGAGSTAFYYTGALIEQNANPVGNFFPTPAPLASGEAGFSGTAHASASDIGPFARGTVRSFVGVANRTGSAAEDALFGASVSRPLMQIEGASDTRLYNATASAVVGSWPGPDQAVFFALKDQRPTEKAEISLDGKSGEEKSLPGAYPTPGGSLILGAWNGGANGNFHGSLLPFDIYGRALT